MANPNEGFVDISSSAEVNKVYVSERRTAPPVKVKGHTGLRVFALILSIIMLLSGTGVLGYYYFLDSFNFSEKTSQTKTKKTTGANNEGDTTLTVSGTSNSNLLSSDDVLNILLFGQDAHASENDFGRSDTTVLMSIDNVHKKIKLTSFQRDTLVNIPGYGDNKINAAFSLGGEKLAIETVEANFGVKIDKYATVDFTAFRQIINQLGGIDIELTTDEIQYINAQIDVNHQQNKTSFLTYDETKPKQMMHLDGYQALWYARNRGADSLGDNPDYSFNGDDWDRTSRQRNLIETIIKSLRNEANFADLVAIVNKVGPYVTTNLKKSDINFLVSNMMTYLKYDVVQLSMQDMDWAYAYTADGQSVIEIRDWNKVRTSIAKFIYEEAVTVS